ncbi:hypothetical protein IKF81_03860 [Candidatus Saccharibacteria bacterium]|nr:hypothetical protein [Candidatus Saccharibacteria bacterium]
MNVIQFAKETEKLVNPSKVGKVNYLQGKLGKLPVFIQKKIVLSATKKADKMSFVVEPYAFFLFFELERPNLLQKYLPENFVPAEASIFSGDKPKFYGVASMFRVHTSVFWGARVECYAITKNAETGLISWTILDYMSDTISYDKKHGLKSPDVVGGVMTTTCEGDFVCEMERLDDSRSMRCTASLLKPKMRLLDERMWIDGNTSISYSKELGGADGGLFSLTFFPEEMKQAWEIPLSNVREARAKWISSALGGKLDKAVCFPFAQHMLSDSPGVKTHYGSKEKLRKAAEAVDFRGIKTLGK